MPVRLGPGAVLCGSLPRISPLPGHTPKPVVVGVVPVPGGGRRLEWSASDEASLAGYELRGCAGKTYIKKRERLILKVAADGERVAVLPQGAGRMCYKIYVVLKTGNERGSRAVG